MIESETEGFEYNNPGYTLHLTGLPEGELVFTLCKEAKSIAPAYNNPIIPFLPFETVYTWPGLHIPSGINVLDPCSGTDT